MEYFKAFVLGGAGWTGTLVIKREALEEAGLFRAGQPVANDLDMWWRVAYRWGEIGYNPEPLAIYHMHIPDSITKKYRQAVFFSELIERHLELAAGHGREKEFQVCAEHMLRWWIHHYFFDERIVDIREMVVRFDRVLPGYYKSLLRLLTISPRATAACLPVLRKINRFLHLRI